MKKMEIPKKSTNTCDTLECSWLHSITAGVKVSTTEKKMLLLHLQVFVQENRKCAKSNRLDSVIVTV